MKWNLVVSPKVATILRALPPNTKRYVREAFDVLRRNPWSGKALRDELSDLYSFRVRRFRIVYKIESKRITVIVLGVGHRKTIY